MAFTLGRMGVNGFSRMGSLSSANPRPYDPVAALGSDLIAYWDANRPDLITQSSGAVSSWLDIVAGYDMVQATGAAKPTYSATSFNGAPGVTFDGADDCLTCTDAALLAALPTGAAAGEMWAVASQDAAAADATTRFIAAFGGGSSTTARSIQRAVVSSANRAKAQLGDGASTSLGATDPLTDFNGRHVLRHQVDATTASITANGGSPTIANIVGATSSTRVRVGSSSVNTAGNFWQGQIPLVMITKPLSVQKAAALQTYLNSRRRP